MRTRNLRVDWPNGVRYIVAVDVRHPAGPADGSLDDAGGGGPGLGPLSFPGSAEEEPDEALRIGETALDSLANLKRHLRRITRDEQPGATVPAWVWDRDEERLLEVLNVSPPVPDPIAVAVAEHG
jgi:hypothetical protein